MGTIAQLAAVLIERLFGKAALPVVFDTPAPKDLEETFFDERAQERVGKVISRANASVS